VSSLKKAKGKKNKKTAPVDRFGAKQVRDTLQEYITALTYAPDGSFLAAATAAGELILYRPKESIELQGVTEKSLDCLAFSPDGQYLAAGGQDSQLRVWSMADQQLILSLDNSPRWIEHLDWSSDSQKLAFSHGNYVQVWDVAANGVVTTLHFDASSVLGVAWHPITDHLAIAGYQGVKIWDGKDWDEDPYHLNIPSTTQAVSWSRDGKYLAAGNFDQTLVVLKWGQEHPWVMRGFPGKVRSIAWSEVEAKNNAPLLTCASAEGVIVWEKEVGENTGWGGRLLEGHLDKVTIVSFQPETLLLASGGADGQICLWHKAHKLKQLLLGGKLEFSSIAWHPQGTQLAAGTDQGELLIWDKSTQGQGFG
jgi:WD40 repeat protein